MTGSWLWGKILFDKKSKERGNFMQENIWVMFDLPDEEEYPLHVSELREDEIYFDVLCEYEERKHINLEPYKLAENGNFMIWDYSGEKNTGLNCVLLYERYRKLQRVLETLLNQKGARELTFFHTEMGPPFNLKDYEEFNWKVEDFALELFKVSHRRNMIPPDFKVVFKK